MTEKQKDILLVAEYMGGREYIHKAHYPHYMQVEAELLDGNDLRFDTSYDWLIPVVKKAMFEIRMEISEDPLAILGGDDERKKELRRTRDKLENTLLTCDIEKLHPIVVQAIKLITGKKH